MPSWNIHIAQTEQLFARDGAVARSVFDRNAFLFGTLVPDIPVGYMVPGTQHPIAYRETHFAAPEHIPKPREWEFWNTYVVPQAQCVGLAIREAIYEENGADILPIASASPSLVVVSASQCAMGRSPRSQRILASSIADERERMNHTHYPQRYEGVPFPPDPSGPWDNDLSPKALKRSVFDLLLGTWAHLVADRIWNLRVSEYLLAHNEKPSDSFRVRKQADFDWFGKTLPIVSVPRVTARLVAAAGRFPQYAITHDDVLVVAGVTHEIVRTNESPAEHPPFLLLSDEFFDRTLAEVIDVTNEQLAARLAG